MSRPGYTVDPAAQDAERGLDKRANAVQLADLEELLRQAWGRRLYYRLVFELGGLEAASFEPAVKDGICAALHMARNEGIRELAGVMAAEAQRYFPRFWNLMLQERVAAAADEQRKRDQARTLTTTEGDS